MTEVTDPPRWSGVAAGSALVVISYWAIVLGFVIPDFDGGGIQLADRVTAGGPLLLGLILVPIAFLVIACVSKRIHPIRTGGIATGVALVVGGIVASVTSIPTGLVAGFGIGGAMSLGVPRGAGIRHRWWFIAAAVVVSLLLHAVEPQIALFVSSVLPIVASGVADSVALRRASASD